MSNAPRCNKDMTMTDAEGRRIGRQTQKITDARRNGTGVPDGTERGGGLGAGVAQKESGKARQATLH